MLNLLLLSGWFRPKPCLKLLIFLMLSAPLASVVAEPTLAESINVAKVTSPIAESATGTTSQSQQTLIESLNVADKTHNPVDKSVTILKDCQPKLVATLTVGHEPVVKVSIQPTRAGDTQSALAKWLKKADVVVPTLGSATPPATNSLATADIIAAKTESAPLPVQLPASSEGSPTEQTQNDPLGSPHPIPWDWITGTHEKVTAEGKTGTRYYRSQSLVSPDGHFAVYSRVQMDVQPELPKSRVSSIMFLEDLQSGKLQMLSANSQSTHNHQVKEEDINAPGGMSVLIPVSWSENGERLLSRQLEGLLSTSDATDSAVIWERTKNRTTTVAPSHEVYNHEIAVLLGWSKADPDQVLFRAGNLGDERWPIFSVATGDGDTIAATKVDQPVVFGQEIKQIWTGPQVAYR